MKDQHPLLSAVLTRYRSINKFAEAIGWSYARAYRIVNGVQAPDIYEAREILKILGINDAGTAISLFSLL